MDSPAVRQRNPAHRKKKPDLWKTPTSGKSTAHYPLSWREYTKVISYREFIEFEKRFFSYPSAGDASRDDYRWKVHASNAGTAQQDTVVKKKARKKIRVKKELQGAEKGDLCKVEEETAVHSAWAEDGSSDGQRKVHATNAGKAQQDIAVKKKTLPPLVPPCEAQQDIAVKKKARKKKLQDAEKGDVCKVEEKKAQKQKGKLEKESEGKKEKKAGLKSKWFRRKKAGHCAQAGNDGGEDDRRRTPAFWKKFVPCAWAGHGSGDDDRRKVHGTSAGEAHQDIAVKKKARIRICFKKKLQDAEKGDVCKVEEKKAQKQKGKQEKESEGKKEKKAGQKSKWFRRKKAGHCAQAGHDGGEDDRRRIPAFWKKFVPCAWAGHGSGDDDRRKVHATNAGEAHQDIAVKKKARIRFCLKKKLQDAEKGDVCKVEEKKAQKQKGKLEKESEGKKEKKAGQKSKWFRRKKAGHCAQAGNDVGVDDRRRIPGNHTDEVQRIPASWEKAGRYARAGNDGGEDDRRKVHATSASEAHQDIAVKKKARIRICFKKKLQDAEKGDVCKVEEKKAQKQKGKLEKESEGKKEKKAGQKSKWFRRKKAGHCAQAGHDVGEDDRRRIPGNHADEFRRSPASWEKAGRHVWAKGGSTDAQGSDAMTDVEKLWASVNPTNVCAVASRTSSASPTTEPAGRSTDAWIGALSNKTGQVAEAAHLCIERRRSSAARECDLGDKAENKKSDKLDRYKLFAGLAESLEAGVKNRNDNQMAPVAVGLAGPGLPPVATAAAPWMETSSSRTTKKKTLPPLVPPGEAQQDIAVKKKTCKKIRVRECDLGDKAENKKSEKWDRYELFMGLVDALEAGVKKFDEKEKIYRELAQKAGVSVVAASAAAPPATTEADRPRMRMRVAQNQRCEDRVMEYPTMSDFSELEDTDDSDQEAICKELVEALEDYTREIEEKIKQLSAVNRNDKQRVPVAVGPDRPGLPPVATAAAPWMETSSSRTTKKKTLPPLVPPCEDQQDIAVKKKARKKIQDAEKGEVCKVEEKKAAHCSWTEDGSSDDVLQRIPAINADRVQRIPAFRKNAVHCAWAGDVSSDDDQRKVHATNACKAQQDIAVKKKARKKIRVKNKLQDAEKGDVCKVEEKKAQKQKGKLEKESEGKKEKKAGQKSKWFRSPLCCFCWLPCIYGKSSRKPNQKLRC